MRIGIDLGGTKIEGVVLDKTNRVVKSIRVPTPVDNYREILSKISELVLALERECGRRCSVGVGMPGTISPARGVVKNANTVVLNGRDIKTDLYTHLSRQIIFANDANCFALSEATDGAAAGLPIVFGVIIGTGTGGGIVVNGQLLTGVNSIAGEWGHNPLPWPGTAEQAGPRCYCGQRLCLETFLSGRGLQWSYEQVGGNAKITAAEIARRSRSGEEAAILALERYADRLARGLAMVINIIDPDAIVLGGGLSQIPALYDLVPSKLKQYVFSDQVATKVLRAKHGDSSGVRGAAWLGQQPQSVAAGVIDP